MQSSQTDGAETAEDQSRNEDEPVDVEEFIWTNKEKSVLCSISLDHSFAIHETNK